MIHWLTGFTSSNPYFAIHISCVPDPVSCRTSLSRDRDINFWKDIVCHKRGKCCPITLSVLGGDRFNARHLSISQLRDGGSYLLSVVAVVLSSVMPTLLNVWLVDRWCHYFKYSIIYYDFCVLKYWDEQLFHQVTSEKASANQESLLKGSLERSLSVSQNDPKTLGHYETLVR